MVMYITELLSFKSVVNHLSIYVQVRANSTGSNIERYSRNSKLMHKYHGVG